MQQRTLAALISTFFALLNSSAEACICAKIMAPVCGKDGTTYSNACMAKCKGVEVASNGPCKTVAGPICEAAAWNANAGVFSVAANWKSKTVPQKNDVVVLSGTVRATVTNQKTKSIGHLVVIGKSLDVKGTMNIVGDLECTTGTCAKTGKGDFYDVVKQDLCSAQPQPPTKPTPKPTQKPTPKPTPAPPAGPDVCAASAWQSKVKGMFSDAKKWLGQSVPKKNSIVVLAGSRVESKKVVNAGHFVLLGGALDVTGGSVNVLGGLSCIGEECKTKALPKFLTFDRSENEMCPVAGGPTPPTKPTKKPTKPTKKPTKPTKPTKKPTKPTKPTKKPTKPTKPTKKPTKPTKKPTKPTKKPTKPTKPTKPKATTKKGPVSQCVAAKAPKKFTEKEIKLNGGAYWQKSGFAFNKCNANAKPGTAIYPFVAVPGATYRLQFTAFNVNTKSTKASQISLTAAGKKLRALTFKGKSASANYDTHFVASGKTGNVYFQTQFGSCFQVANVVLTQCKPVEGGKCKATCQGFSCDYWAGEEDYTCDVLTKDYGCNCQGCKCPADKKVCANDKCNGKSCDEWVKLGVSCDSLKKNYKCTCSLCQCNEPVKKDTTKPRTTTTTSTTTSTTTPARETTSTSTSTTTSTTTLSGCMNKAACNYNKNAKADDGSCNLPKNCLDCKGKCICKVDACGVCGGKGPGSDMKACAAKKGVQVNWIKDKTCDDAHNNCVCGWDGGDCCMNKEENPDTFKYCSKCGCLDPTFVKEVKKGDCGICEGKCGKPKYKGDKYCDDENNNCACNWDGGDCCGQGNNYKYCKDCQCKDCKFEHKGDKCVKSMKGTCGQAKWKGDGNCDDENNNAGCNWDGGDCCGANNYGYCKQCKCLDCTYEAKGDDCTDNIKAACGSADYVGDKFCDDNNNNAGCNWDKGDCCGPANNYKFCKKCECKDCTYESKGDDCVSSIKKGCGSPNWKGDGNCDDNNNNAGCNWDGGDCCGTKNYQYCKECKCKDCTYKKKGDKCIDDFKKACGAPKFKGDGYCDDSNNVGGCNWDGGDCCGDKANKKYCKVCDCRDCTKVKPKDCPNKKGKCGSPDYKKDTNCDDENNNCQCDWDGGDCCAKSNNGSVKTKYCKACACLDPANKGDSNCKGYCKFPNYKGDGNCDDENNNCGCNYDGGDCCKKTAPGNKVKTTYCKACKCLDPSAGGSDGSSSGSCEGKCAFPNYKGDGNCDDENNVCGCEYDGGDCCLATVKDGKFSGKYCKECKCKDPDGCPGKCKFPNYKGDGNCDDENNNCGCAYDGGDCCAQTAKNGKVIKEYCKDCLCIDQAVNK